MPKPIEKYSPGLSELWIWLPATEKSQEGAQDLQPCYHQGITRVSAAPGVTCDGGRHATAKGGPSKGLTRRRGDFAIVNSWDGGWERGKQSALSGLAVAPERLSLASEQHI